MPKLVLHAASERQLTSFAARPSHGLILLGVEGAGKGAVARGLVGRLLNLPDEVALEKYPYVKIVVPDGQSISIDAVRDMLRFTKLQVTGDGDTRRAIVIEQAHLLTIEAQNALLKLLEEPPAGTVLVLTAASGQALLPTICSRAQIITLLPPAQAALGDFFVAQGYAPAAVRQAYLMSGGLPGLMHALLENSNEHPLVRAAKQARELVAADRFSRLVLVDALAKQRVECGRVLFVLQQMAHAALQQSAAKTSGDRTFKQWQRVLAAAYDAETALQANAQPKLVLTNFMLTL